MNDELNKALSEILIATKEGVINIGIAVQQQAPELAKEILSYGLLSSIFEGILSLVFVVAYFIILPKVIKFGEDNDYNPLPVMYYVIGGILVVLSIISFVCCIEQILKISSAPKLFVIDYVKKLIIVSK